jgi:porin
VIRVGKSVPTYDFNNVSRPVPVTDSSLSIPAVTGLIYTPAFINPTLIGVMPGYYNSAYGITTTFAPTKPLYLSYAVYDGALASGIQTGLREGPVFNGHYFHIGEAGYAWTLGSQQLPGLLALGGWAQTGKLSAAGVTEDGAQGFYTFGSQRLWRRRPGTDNSGISGFFQFGINDSRTLIAHTYFGFGFTGFGLVPGRPVDSLGAGLAWSWLNRHFGFRSNEGMMAAYYQMHLVGSIFFQPTLTYIPNPGSKPGTPGAVALTSQVTALF